MCVFVIDLACFAFEVTFSPISTFLHFYFFAFDFSVCLPFAFVVQLARRPSPPLLAYVARYVCVIVGFTLLFYSSFFFLLPRNPLTSIFLSSYLLGPIVVVVVVVSVHLVTCSFLQFEFLCFLFDSVIWSTHIRCCYDFLFIVWLVVGCCDSSTSTQGL